LMEKAGAFADRVAEGRTQAVNAALARMVMQTDPAQLVRMQGLVERARQQAQQTALSRAQIYRTSPIAALTPQVNQMMPPRPPSPPGLLDQFWQGQGMASPGG